AAVSLGLSLSASWAQNINFGIISTEATQNLKADWQPLIDDMAKQTGLKVTAFFAPDYAGIIEGMRFNKVQVAWLGNKSAMEAVDRANGEVFAQMVNADGTQGYYSHLIVHKDSPIQSLDDVIKNGKSLSFGNGDPNSTSGFLVPGFYVFAKNKIDAKQHFKIVRSANHETNALAVANRQVDVATNNSENLGKIKERQPEKFKDIRVVWTSPLIPLDPLVLHKDLPAATKEKVKNFFYNYARTDAREQEIVMKISKLSGFKPSSNAQLIPIRELDLFSKRNKVEADTTLAAADKAARLAEIDKLLAALQ
ncbi:MAG: phosphonate ABC transporter substrate-binding protein, partial [Gammaproteobacteria bacterium]